MRRLAFALVYCVFLAGFVAAVDYLLFWRLFYTRLRGAQTTSLAPPPHVDELTMRRVGSLRADRRSSFSAFDPAKGAGVVRVCAFGDSFTYGDEVADGHDYPSLLQDVFDEHGFANVEVLNFGNSWYGFHQTYVLWDGVGRRYECDFVLLGPDGFQHERDTTFNHTDLAFPYYLHARYVLDGDGVQLVDVLGRTAEERFAEYFAFWPRKPYLRYDRRAPAFLQAMMLSGQILANPFYYLRQPPEEEARRTYERLLRELASAPTQIVLFHSLPHIVELGEALGRENLVTALAPRPERFPYHAPGGHLSSFGNRWLAEQYYALLTSTEHRPLVLDFTEVAQRAQQPPARAGAAPAISEYESIHVEMNGRPAGFLAVASADSSQRGGAPTDLAGSGAVGLLALQPAGKSIVDAAFVATKQRPREGERIVLRSSDGDAQLGTVRLLDAGASIGVAVIAGLEFPGGLVLRPNGAQPRGEATLLMGSTPLLRAVPAPQGVTLEPLQGSLRGVRVRTGEYVSVAELAGEGTVELVANVAGRAARLPLARWSLHEAQAFAARRTLPQRIVTAGGRAAVAGRRTSQQAVP